MPENWGEERAAASSQSSQSIGHSESDADRRDAAAEAKKEAKKTSAEQLATTPTTPETLAAQPSTFEKLGGVTQGYAANQATADGPAGGCGEVWNEMIANQEANRREPIHGIGRSESDNDETTTASTQTSQFKIDPSSRTQATADGPNGGAPDAWEHLQSGDNGNGDSGGETELTKPEKKGFFTRALDGTQSVINFSGFIPVLGAVPDLINAGIYAIRRDATNAALSALSAIPFAGDMIAGGALGVKAAKAFNVGPYKQIQGTLSGYDAHHVGQKAIMSKWIPDYNPKTAPAILVPEVGHTKSGAKGIVARTGEFNGPRELLARDINELRRVYEEIPNSQLQELIKANKEMYPGAFDK